MRPAAKELFNVLNWRADSETIWSTEYIVSERPCQLKSWRCIDPLIHSHAGNGLRAYFLRRDFTLIAITLDKTYTSPL